MDGSFWVTSGETTHRLDWLELTAARLAQPCRSISAASGTQGSDCISASRSPSTSHKGTPGVFVHKTCLANQFHYSTFHKSHETAEELLIIFASKKQRPKQNCSNNIKGRFIIDFIINFFTVNHHLIDLHIQHG